MNKELIETEGLWLKIKRFFRKIFFKKKVNNTSEIQAVKIVTEDNTFALNNSLKEKFEEENNKKFLAEKLLYGELGTSELTEIEADEMTEYFTKDIRNLDNELLRIKQHIIAMKKELKKEDS